MHPALKFLAVVATALVGGAIVAGYKAATRDTGFLWSVALDSAGAIGLSLLAIWAWEARKRRREVPWSD